MGAISPFNAEEMARLQSESSDFDAKAAANGSPAQSASGRPLVLRSPSTAEPVPDGSVSIQMEQLPRQSAVTTASSTSAGATATATDADDEQGDVLDAEAGLGSKKSRKQQQKKPKQKKKRKVFRSNFVGGRWPYPSVQRENTARQVGNVNIKVEPKTYFVSLTTSFAERALDCPGGVVWFGR